ncbi:MAG: hypothetical protein QOI62_2267 [Solirubrobacteraceae bacterium]|jgi:hypothetical protein|nr:hypothetical protein [Solirubrobacteraceae bacterium]
MTSADALPSRAVDRTPAWVAREYGAEKWPEVERLVDGAITAETEPQLARVLHRVARSQWESPNPLTRHDSVVDGHEVRLPRSAAFGAQQALILDVLAASCRPDTALVAELGSGWAWHLLSFWLSGGPPQARYVGAEYTQAGRRAASRLAALDSRLRFQSLAFDFHAPVLEAVDVDGHALVYTQHAVEQVPELRSELFAVIRSIASRVTCIHFEPVGWQVHAGVRAGSSRAYAEHHDYNRNLVELLREEEASGRLVIDAMAPEVVGVNPANATTVIAWSSA